MVYNQLYMEYKLPEGTNSTRVVHDLREIETYLKSRKEITHVTTSVGGTPGRYNLVRSIANPSLSYGELIIDFTSPEDWWIIWTRFSLICRRHILMRMSI